MSKLLSKFKRNSIDSFIDSLDDQIISSISIADPGTGYTNSEVVGLIGGTSVVVQTNGSGEVVSIEPVSLATYNSSVNPLGVMASNGSGTGLSFNLSFEKLNKYYAFSAKVSEYPTSDVDPEEETQHSEYQTWDEMLFGKMPTFGKMTERYDWANNTLFQSYDDTLELKGTNFFCVTDSRDVFKCIGNNGSANSTVKPVKNASQVGKPFETADGYQWMYMYTIPKSDYNKFTTKNYIPVVENTIVTEAAVDGTLFSIVVSDGGFDYPNHAGTISAVSNTTTFTIGSTASTNANYYTDSSIRVTDTEGTTYVRKITASNASRVLTTEAFPSGFLNTSCVYSIGPTVEITSKQGAGAVAYCVMDSNDGSITKIQMVEYGSGYKSGTSVSLTAGAGFGEGALARAIISPNGGHGSNIYDELYVDCLGIHCLFDEPGLPNTFNTDITYRTVGLIKNPVSFSGEYYESNTFNQICTINITSGAGVFQNGEDVVGQVSGASGKFAFSNSTVLSLTGVLGTFQNGESIVGQTSNATAITTSTMTQADLKLYSGDILYVQNIQPVARSSSSQEQIKLIIKF